MKPNRLTSTIWLLVTLATISCSKNSTSDPISGGVQPSAPETQPAAKEDSHKVLDSASSKALLAKASKGDAHAQYNLAVMYYEGTEIAQDYAQAAKWYRKAAAQGMAEAQSNLGAMYHDGKGMLSDDSEAIKWLQKAATQGMAEAQQNLALMYHGGMGTPVDYSQAMKWFRKAADQNVAQAQYNLALMYGKGEGTPMDIVQTYMWASLAAENGNPDAATLVAKFEPLLTPAQIDQGREKVAQWKLKLGTK